MAGIDHQGDARHDEDWEDWVVVGQEDEGEEWWRVPEPPTVWAYRRDREWTESGLRLPFYPKLPYLDHVAQGVQGHDGEEDEDTRLSLTLTGVQVVEDVVRRYEVDAGIALPYDPIWDQAVRARRARRVRVVDESAVVASKKQWREQEESLLGGILEPLPYDPCDPRIWEQDLTGSPSTATDSTRPRTPSDPDIIDLTVSVSDISVDSDAVPRTPLVDKKSYAAAVFDERMRPTNGVVHSDGTVVSPSPAKPLSASALSFVPTFILDPTPSSPSPDAPYVSATYEFHFPSLNSQTSGRAGARSLPPNLQRDEHGFYTDVPATSPSPSHTPTSTRSATPKRQTSSLLPAFLTDASSNARTRHTSKTREIVDRLRSSNSGARRHRRGKDSGSQHLLTEDVPKEGKEEENASAAAEDTLVTTPDGWITGIEDADAISPERPNEDWVASLFRTKPAQPQSQSQSQPPQTTQSQQQSASTNGKPKSKTVPPPTPAHPPHHRRAQTTGTATVSTPLHSPASSITSFGMPPTPVGAPFPAPPPQYYPYQPAYGPYVMGPPPPPHPPHGPYIMPPWQMQMQMAPRGYHTHGYVMPGPMPPPPPPPSYHSSEKPSPMAASR